MTDAHFNSPLHCPICGAVVDVVSWTQTRGEQPKVPTAGRPTVHERMHADWHRRADESLTDAEYDQSDGHA